MISSIITFLAIVFAQHGHYDDALPLLNKSVLVCNDADRPSHHFWRAIAAYQTFHPDEAKDSCAYICEGFRNDIPKRYEHLCYLMSQDMKLWKDDLHEIRARMNDVTKKLEVANASKPTQTQQKKIVELLDKKIKQLEDEENAKNQKASNSSGDSKPKESSQLPEDVTGKGLVDSPELRKKLENLGSLPPAERRKIEQQIVQNVPAKYRAMIEEYFKALNK